MKTGTLIIGLALGVCSLISCNKKKFLDEKPDSDFFVPTTLEDFQALLDNDAVISVTPVLGELSADNYYLPSTFWQGLSLARERNSYNWAVDIYNGEVGVLDWNTPYEQVFYANVVLDGLKKLAKTPDNAVKWNAMKGSALFTRAFAFHNLAQIFAPVYDLATANKPNSGIPLRLSPNIDEPTRRSTVQDTYTQILNDLLEASELLPDTINYAVRTRPSKPAALALLARVYLSMSDYEKAQIYADRSLSLYNKLIDYNKLPNINANFPFDKFNDETLYQGKTVFTNVLKGGPVKDCILDSNIFQSYLTNDLRKSAFYSYNTFNFPNPKGSYNATIFAFTGLATDELYLIRAECKARNGLKDEALTDLNVLLSNRFKTGFFTPVTATTTDEAVTMILKERRKELPFRGVRWSDLRRLNKENGRKTTLTRILNGQTYTLAPGDSRYVLPIPPDIIQFANIPQNERR